MTNYEILGIEKDATQEQIKIAYHTLAKKYHPDVNDASNAAALFRLIKEAYETLSDPQKRAEYDNESNAPEQYSSDEYVNFAGENRKVYSYEEIKSDTKEPRYKSFPFADTILTIIVAAFCLNMFVHIHIAISILIGIAVDFVFAMLFDTKIGSWIISVFYSAVWATLIGGLVYTLSRDNIWLWCTFSITFVVSLASHRISDNI